MLGVTPADVAASAPDAPPVAAAQVEEALDWAEPLLTQAGIVLAPGSREERAAKRAVANYALHLAVVGKASSVRASSSGGQARKFEVGPIKVERTQTDTQAQASGMVEAAGEYLGRAWAALYVAGVPRPFRVAGASR